MPGINFYEFVLLFVLALVLVGPERLPQYVQNLARWARKVRSMAEGAKVRFREETGAEFDAVDWQKYDPRQYDPRRIIRDALAEDYEEVRSEVLSLKKNVDPRELFAPTAASSADDTQRGAPAVAAAGPVMGPRGTGAVEDDSSCLKTGGSDRSGP